MPSVSGLSMKFLSSLKTTVFLFVVIICILSYATLQLSFEQAVRAVYSKWWFEGLFFLVGINLLLVVKKHRLYKNPPLLMLHAGIVLMLLGGFVSRHFGFKGILHLREMEASNLVDIADSQKGVHRDLGFVVRLDRFVVKRYPGSDMASGYESFVTITDGDRSYRFKIYMNHPLKYNGYVFYQMSYDPDEGGTILLVKKDPGVWIVYAGYFVFSLGFLLFLVGVLKRRWVVFFAFLSILYPFTSNSMDIQGWADSSGCVAVVWANLMVQQNGRIEPMDTLDLNISLKLTGKRRLYGMDYNQLVLGMVSYPELFEKLKIILVNDRNIESRLGINTKYASYEDFFYPDGEFKLAGDLALAMKKPPSELTKTEKNLLKLNDRLYVAYSVFNGSIFRLFPVVDSVDNNYRWVGVDLLKTGAPHLAESLFGLFEGLIDSSRQLNCTRMAYFSKRISGVQKEFSSPIIPSHLKIKAEIVYNRLDLFSKLTWLYLSLSVLSMFASFGFKRLSAVFWSFGLVVFIIHALNMGLRWYIASHMPWSDAYESLVFIAFCIAAVGVVFFRRDLLGFACSFFAAGLFMFIAHLDNIDPQITPIVPVLDSYWLLFHVAVITVGYGFFALTWVLSAVGVVLHLKRDSFQSEIDRISGVLKPLIILGVGFLSIGTLLGGVWANESWGSYWSWDPKETWSLISILAYSVVLHMGFKRRDGVLFFAFVFFSFFFILMTYFGVNFFISGGLHSYSRGSGSFFWLVVLEVGLAAWLVLFLYMVAKRRV
ncbi:cytochrome c biogenesis protein CcsA [Hippea sp. KM1]|uniref:cytochrome c biogenesis protein CcsA n=1 Tax=Hippea sp. KM1 TaxID=944481 RepID=UPI0004AE8150|nr:cytochrome c biogenesis protein CcsA [Hippea sp. KM1]